MMSHYRNVLRMAAYEEGRAAFERGEVIYESPYREGTDSYEHWVQGWGDAKRESEQGGSVIRE